MRMKIKKSVPNFTLLPFHLDVLDGQQRKTK